MRLVLVVVAVVVVVVVDVVVVVVVVVLVVVSLLSVHLPFQIATIQLTIQSRRRPQSHDGTANNRPETVT